MEQQKQSTNLPMIVENETGEEEDQEDDEGVPDERDIWDVTHVTEEDFETTEGETVTWGWTKKSRKQTETPLVFQKPLKRIVTYFVF